MTTDPRNDISSELSKATAKLDVEAAARKKAEDAQRELDRKEEEQIQAAKNLATQFNRRQIEPMFRDFQNQLSESGFSLTGNYIDDEGSQGRVLIASDVCGVTGSIRHTKSTLTIHLQCVAGGSNPIYLETKQFPVDGFDEQAAAEQFRLLAKEAISRLLNSGVVSRSRPILPGQ